MDFVKKDIHITRLRLRKNSQYTFDDDFIIPDSKGDIDRVIAKHGRVVNEEVSCESGKVRIRGVIYFQMIYKVAGEPEALEFFSGDIAYEDQINMEGMQAEYKVQLDSALTDLTISVINSRKFEVRGLIETKVCVYDDSEQKVITGLINAQGIECQKKAVGMTECVLVSNDVLRVKEDLSIPQNKPNISDILWQNVYLKGMDIKLKSGAIIVKGELELFVIYKGMDEELPFQYMYVTKAYSQEIKCSEADEELMYDIDLNPGRCDVSIKKDSDGEERIIGVDYSVDLGIRLYRNTSIEIINDMYSTNAELILKKERLDYDNLIVKNRAKAKLNVKKTINSSGGRLLQICNTYGDVEIDDVNAMDDILHISGVLKCRLLYVSSGEEPMSCYETDIPFEYEATLLEGKQENKNISYIVKPSVCQISSNMQGNDEVEIRAEIDLSVSAFEKCKTDTLADMSVEPIDYSKKGAVPGIVGYIVKPEDTIWSIARKYYATVDSIKSINKLEGDELHEGDRLLIVKS